ncbi:MAG: response regulator [Verrucomicrobia bacterium]|nr:response regulator [Verrucomicrobiota bacterium]MBT7068387.1 response regulator [Verrucomicrobiota bacterium]MBT7699153.1 response regulator [Verrucomicrobiota bacterium]
MMEWARIQKRLADAPYGVQLLLVAVFYYVGARLGLYLSFPDQNIGALWPPNAVLLTALLTQPRRRWWGFLLVVIPAELAADLAQGLTVTQSMLFLLADYTEVLLAAFMLRAVLSGPLMFNRMAEMLAFIAAAVVVAPFASSFVGAMTSGAGIGQPEYWLGMRTWFLSDALTHITFTPLLVVLFGVAGGQRRTRPEVGWGERLAVAASLVVVGLTLFRHEPSQLKHFHSLYYLPIPLLVWAAVRLGPRYCFGCGLTIALLAVWNASRGHGPFAGDLQVHSVLDLQAFLLLCLTPIALLSVVIMERRHAQDALRESEEKYRLLVDHAGDMVVRTDAQGRLRYVSPEYCRVFGKSEDELLGESFLPMVHEEDRAATEASLQALQMPPYISYVEQRAETCKGWQWIAWRGKGVVDADGALVATIGVGRNIQSLKDAEKEREVLRERLGRAEKMEALNLLAGGVAHDLNNILSGVISYPDLLLLDLPAESELRAPLETIRESGFRAAAVVKDMAGLSRGMETTLIPGSLSRILNEYLASGEHADLLRRYPGVEIKVDVDAGVLGITCSPLRLRSAVANLIKHAVETAGPDGRVRVKTENRYVELPLRGFEEIAAGEYVVLTVTDSGTMISKDDLPRIFDPFYTRKVMGWGGTGLGLTVIWNIVHDHGGYVDVSSRDDGTTFAFYLPATRMRVPDTSETERARQFEGGGEHILVVDDEPAQRLIAQHILQRLNYRAETAASGEEAVTHLETHPVDLVLLDMIMPRGMDGQETYVKLAAIQPDLKAVVASGFADLDTIRRMRDVGVMRYIEKPYTMASLAREIYAELHEGA